jgi:hypothetical protein
MKFLHFLKFFVCFVDHFCPSWIRIQICFSNADPDPADQNQIGSMRIRIRIHRTEVVILIVLADGEMVLEVEPNLAILKSFIVE